MQGATRVPKRTREIDARPLFNTLLQCEERDGVVYTAGESDNGAEKLRRYGAMTLPYARELCFALLPIVLASGPPLLVKLHRLDRRAEGGIKVEVSAKELDLLVHATEEVAIAARDRLNTHYPPETGTVLPYRKKG